MENSKVVLAKVVGHYCTIEGLSEKMQTVVLTDLCKSVKGNLFDAYDYAVDCNIEYNSTTGEVVEMLVSPQEYDDALYNHCIKSIATLIQYAGFTIDDFDGVGFIEVDKELKSRGSAIRDYE